MLARRYVPALVLLLVLAGCSGGTATETPEDPRQRAAIGAMENVDDYRALGSVTVEARSEGEAGRADIRFRKRANRSARRSCQAGWSERSGTVAREGLFRTAQYVEDDELDAVAEGGNTHSHGGSSVADADTLWAERTLYGRQLAVLKHGSVARTLDAGPNTTTLVVAPDESWLADSAVNPWAPGRPENVTVSDAVYRFTLDDDTDRPVRIVMEFDYRTDDVAGRLAGVLRFAYPDVSVPDYPTPDENADVGMSVPYPAERCTDVVERPVQPSLHGWAQEYWDGNASKNVDGVVDSRNASVAATP